MFGPNFAEHFGIPNLEFPMQGIDPQGGLFGPNAPNEALIGSQPLGPQSTAPSPSAPSAGLQGAAQPAPEPAPPTAASPLGNPMQAGAQPMQQPQQPTAPIAGMGSPLGMPQL